MKTLILQSVAPVTPNWINRCIGSVISWAAQYGYAYLLTNDLEFFANVPESFKHLTPVQQSDIARLYHLGEALAEYDQVVWIDSDVLVFDPDNFNVPSFPFSFAREVIWWNRYGCMAPQISNAFMSFTRGSEDTLADYILRCHAAVDSGKPLDHCGLGADLLTGWVPLSNVLLTLGNFSPDIHRAIYAGNRGILKRARDGHGYDFAAANMMGSQVNTTERRAIIESAIDTLLETRGGVVN